MSCFGSCLCTYEFDCDWQNKLTNGKLQYELAGDGNENIPLGAIGAVGAARSSLTPLRMNLTHTNSHDI
jgi:hypothetical protein